MREIIEGDIFKVLPELGWFDCVAVSLPDAEEVGMSMENYVRWFEEAAELCFKSTAPTGVTIFQQTDRKWKGSLVSKAGLLLAMSRRVLWHKVILRRDVGSVDLYRPTFTHMLCFSLRARQGSLATPDVMQAGQKTWANGAGLDAARFIVEYGRNYGPTFLNPCCGEGTFVACAEPLYEKVVGVEIDADRAVKARLMRVPMVQPRWCAGDVRRGAGRARGV